MYLSLNFLLILSCHQHFSFTFAAALSPPLGCRLPPPAFSHPQPPQFPLPLMDIDRRAEDQTWNTGDFILVSADNVLFRIDSFYLYAARFVTFPGSI